MTISKELQQLLQESCSRKEFQMPKNSVELKITSNDFKYDLNKNIYFTSNLGEIKMDFKDALEIMHTLLDATGHLDKETYELIDEIEDELVS